MFLKMKSFDIRILEFNQKISILAFKKQFTSLSEDTK